ncbi:MAG: hypothetical protein H6Q70_1068 [Firmicutes bacterium]|nr:hypothetical protein [Bacillota bacterium]
MLLKHTLQKHAVQKRTICFILKMQTLQIKLMKIIAKCNRTNCTYTEICSTITALIKEEKL